MAHYEFFSRLMVEKHGEYLIHSTRGKHTKKIDLINQNKLDIDRDASQTKSFLNMSTAFKRRLTRSTIYAKQSPSQPFKYLYDDS